MLRSYRRTLLSLRSCHCLLRPSRSRVLSGNVVAARGCRFLHVETRSLLHRIAPVTVHFNNGFMTMDSDVVKLARLMVPPWYSRTSGMENSGRWREEQHFHNRLDDPNRNEKQNFPTLENKFTTMVLLLDGCSPILQKEFTRTDRIMFNWYLGIFLRKKCRCHHKNKVYPALCRVVEPQRTTPKKSSFCRSHGRLHKKRIYLIFGYPDIFFM